MVVDIISHSVAQANNAHVSVKHGNDPSWVIKPPKLHFGDFVGVKLHSSHALHVVSTILNFAGAHRDRR